MPLPLSALPAEMARGLRGVLCDLDDTLTERGRLVLEALSALERLRAAGLRTVLVTGRPAGWVDHLARMWPLDGVVGENGGLWAWHDGRKLRYGFAQDAATRARNRRRLDELARRILAEVPGAALSADQPYRALDLAIDFREDVPELPPEQVERILQLFEQAGARCKLSSIHVNGWFGDFDKLSGIRHFVAERWGEELDPRDWAFFGDSPNDEPLFAAFPLSVGVANVRRFLPRLRHPPAYLASLPGGRGFAEGAARLLELRGA